MTAQLVQASESNPDFLLDEVAIESVAQISVYKLIPVITRDMV